MAARRFTFHEKLEAARREVKQRRHVYPYRVQQGKMTRQLANEQIALMEAIVADYEEMAKTERLL